MSDSFEIKIELAENGYVVYVPDTEKIDEMKKREKKDGPGLYYGDCRKELVAKTTGEVLEIVKGALSNLPEVEYESAFNEAVKSAGKGER